MLWLVACAGSDEPVPQVEPPVAEVRVYRHLGGDPVEVFGAEDGTQVAYDPDARTLDGVKVQGTWHLGKALPACLIDPLLLPPALDPAGFRRLAWDGSTGAWLLELSGENRCHLEGRLVLELAGPQVDTAQLRVDGLPWKDGGMDRAQENVRAWLRDDARARWEELTPDERRTYVHALAHDPAPDADVALAELLARDPGAADLTAAVEERALRAP